MKISSYRNFIYGLVVAISVPVIADGPAQAIPRITPHQAVYKLSLSSRGAASRFTGLSGAMAFQIERKCQNWEVSEQIVMRMETVAGGTIVREMMLKATESLDGKTFSFDSSSMTNGRREQFKGVARRRDDGTSEAEFIVPEPFEMPLPDGTYFYVGLTDWLLGLAKSGQRMGEAFSFDGSDDEGPQKVTAFILPVKPDSGKLPEKLPGDAQLLSARPWRARLAFFGLAGQATNPEFEIALQFLENGIMTRAEMIFDDMIVNQTLEDVLPASNDGC